MNDYQNHIEKYLKGELTPKEMHELEMKALHDPFLAEALEGAESIHSELFTSDVKSINEKIKSKKTGTYFWPLRIAASILLVAAVTFFIIKIESDDLNQVALQKEIPQEENSEPLSSDSTLEIKNAAENLLSMKADNEPKAKSPVIKKEEPVPVKPIETPTALKQDLVTENQIIQLDSDDALAEEESEKNIAFAKELDEITEQKTAVSKTESLRARSNVLKKSAAPSPASGAGGASRDDKSSLETPPLPVVTREEYQAYLKSNLKYPSQAVTDSIQGEVIVNFLVNSDSTLSDFVVDKGIGHGCDEELIRLIKEGPKWAPSSQNVRVSVSFQFRLSN